MNWWLVMGLNEGAAFGSAHAGRYAEAAPRQVPGHADLHRMTGLLLGERCGPDAQVLVIGAGGGLEIAALAGMEPGWRFVGVDPSQPMLTLAGEMTAPCRDRVRLIAGYAADAPDGPFDGAVCLLTLHFVERAERLATLAAIRERLKPGAPFVVGHISFEQDEPARSAWIARHVAFAGTAPERVAQARAAIGTQLNVLAPHEDEAMLAAAGFSGVTLFYAGLSMRGWVAYA